MTDFVKNKMKKPCSDCPFRKNADKNNGNPGGSNPFVYIGQTRGPFWLPCHKDKNYAAKKSDPSKVQQCAGAAIFRANIELPYKLPDQLLKLDKDTENVFESPAEFLAYYTDTSIEVVEEVLTDDILDATLQKELKDQQAQSLTK